jgi:hypothetical protein
MPTVDHSPHRRLREDTAHSLRVARRPHGRFTVFAPGHVVCDPTVSLQVTQFSPSVCIPTHRFET